MPRIAALGQLGARGFGLTAKPGRPQLTFTYASNTQDASINLSTLPGYRAGESDIVITINSGVYVYGSGGGWNSTGGTGLTVSGGSAGDTCKIVNLGYIMGGGGGASVANNSPGYNGGAAINWNAAINVTIDNTNASAYIAGGGGSGGGASNSGGGGGAGGGIGGLNPFGGSGGGPGLSGSNGSSFSNPKSGSFGGGGGGGRVIPGTGGAGAGNNVVGQGGGAGGGGAGGRPPNGPSGTGGAGGSGQSAGSSGSQSGGGGGWGASGGANTSSSLPGGSGGKAVNLNGKTVTWVSGDTTRVWGAVS